MTSVLNSFATIGNNGSTTPAQLGVQLQDNCQALASPNSASRNCSAACNNTLNAIFQPNNIPTECVATYLNAIVYSTQASYTIQLDDLTALLFPCGWSIEENDFGDLTSFLWLNLSFPNMNSSVFDVNLQGTNSNLVTVEASLRRDVAANFGLLPQNVFVYQVNSTTDYFTGISSGANADVYIQADAENQVSALLNNSQLISQDNGIVLPSLDGFPTLRINYTERQLAVVTAAHTVPASQAIQLLGLQTTTLSAASSASSSSSSSSSTIQASALFP